LAETRGIDREIWLICEIVDSEGDWANGNPVRRYRLDRIAAPDAPGSDWHLLNFLTLYSRLFELFLKGIYDVVALP